MRLHALQYLRAVAALAVVYSHAVIQVDGYEQYLGHAGSFGV
ncbi:MAG: peptidoglycan/LPS O-acetylase OafA/YrhL, partial [Granulosicoccus sp.]